MADTVVISGFFVIFGFSVFGVNHLNSLPEQEEVAGGVSKEEKQLCLIQLLIQWIRFQRKR